MTFSSLDEFYLFSPRESVAPTRISSNEFTDSFDGIKDIVTKEQKEPVVELEGQKSGLKITFDTNRESCIRHAMMYSQPIHHDL